MGAPQVGTGVGQLEALAVGVALVELHAALVIQAVLVFDSFPNKRVVVGGMRFGWILHACPLVGLEV